MIRCERCSTLYELDEGLLLPSGSQVQCTKCQHVFTAYPPNAAGRTELGLPAASDALEPEDAPASAPVTEPPDVAEPADDDAADRAADRADDADDADDAGAADGGAGPPHADQELPEEIAAAPPREDPATGAERRGDVPRGTWGGSAPVYRPPSPPPSAAAVAGVSRSPLLHRDAVGAFESRLRWGARLRWLVPAAIVLVLLGVAGATWLLLARGSTPDDEPARREALALAARDDAGSLDAAMARLEAALQDAPGSKALAADRAAVNVLRAAIALEEGEAIAARRKARVAEGERLRQDRPAGWEEAERQVAADAQALEGAAHTVEERARVLGAAALDSLRTLERAGGEGRPEIARGLGLYYAFRGDGAGAQAAVRAARAATPTDPWLDLAEGWVAARQADPASHERALVTLGSVSVANPGLLRARYLLARTQAALGRRGEALASAEGVLASNGQHEGAKRLREELSAPVEPAGPEPSPAQSGSPPGNAPAQRRKPSSQPSLGPLPATGGPSLAPIPGAVVPAPVPALPDVPVEGTGAPPSPARTSPAGAGGGEPASEPARTRRPRVQPSEFYSNGG